ncbi:hypothetical protein MKX01_007263 [Papaver californicum]|nr:hypothetical protein MKX01_007263 [Papaver californicum]
MASRERIGTQVILGQLEVIQITKFEGVWSCNLSKDKKKCATFYEPVDILDGFFSLGHYIQSHDQPLHGFVLVAREVDAPKTGFGKRPCLRGMMEKSVSVGTFFCSNRWSSGDEMNIACLKNLDHTLHAMPNIDQIHALIKHYGPTFFHPDEIYLPSSLSWFFNNGDLLYKKGDLVGVPIDSMGLNLPCGGSNDKEYWIDLPNDSSRNFVSVGI